LFSSFNIINEGKVSQLQEFCPSKISNISLKEKRG
jgi:hypothetical protein